MAIAASGTGKAASPPRRGARKSSPAWWEKRFMSPAWRPCAGSLNCKGRASDMPLDVRVATSMAEAAGILTADQRTKLLSGGTLVMRDVNEGRLLDGTLLRVTDPAFRQMNTSGARIELGAGVA